MSAEMVTTSTDERAQAITLANIILDKPHIDPDGDISVLARQFLREIERREADRDDALGRIKKLSDALGVSASVLGLASERLVNVHLILSRSLCEASQNATHALNLHGIYP